MKISHTAAVMLGNGRRVKEFFKVTGKSIASGQPLHLMFCRLLDKKDVSDPRPGDDLRCIKQHRDATKSFSLEHDGSFPFSSHI